MTFGGSGGTPITFRTALAISLALTPRVRAFARRRRLADTVDSSRKVHTGRIPRLGGIAIVCAFLASLGVAALSGAVLGSDDAVRFAVLAGGASVLALLGLADDLWNVGARWKLLCQSSVA